MRSLPIGAKDAFGLSKPASSALLFLAIALIETPSFHGRGLIAKRPRTRQINKIITLKLVSTRLTLPMLFSLQIPSQNACVLEPRINHIKNQTNRCNNHDLP